MVKGKIDLRTRQSSYINSARDLKRDIRYNNLSSLDHVLQVPLQGTKVNEQDKQKTAGYASCTPAESSVTNFFWYFRISSNGFRMFHKTNWALLHKSTRYFSIYIFQFEIGDPVGDERWVNLTNGLITLCDCLPDLCHIGPNWSSL